MELLEDRISLSTNLINDTYNLFLGRDAEPAGLAYWTNIIRTYGENSAIIGIKSSLESRTHLVNTWYKQYLNREVIGHEAQIWIDELRIMTEVDVLAQILSSDEYQDNYNGQWQGQWIIHDYYSLLNRPPDYQGLVTWTRLYDKTTQDLAALGIYDYSGAVVSIQKQFLQTEEYQFKFKSSYL